MNAMVTVPLMIVLILILELGSVYVACMIEHRSLDNQTENILLCSPSAYFSECGVYSVCDYPGPSSP